MVMSDDSYDDVLIHLSSKHGAKGVRKAIKEELRRGVSHTEIALKFVGNDNLNIKINPSIITPDAIIAHFVSQKPELAKKHSHVLKSASKMNYTIDNSDHKSYALWALVTAHLFYPEITGVNYLHNNFERNLDQMKELHAHIEKLLNDEQGAHMEVIAKFTDMLAQHTAKIRQILDEEESRVLEYSATPVRSLELLHKSGYKVLALNEGEVIDPCALSIAAKYDTEKILLIIKRANGRLKVSLRAVKGKIGASLYRVLNEEEMKIRKVKSLIDGWNGSQIAGGSPLDGTVINFDRLAMIISRHTKE